MKFRSQSLELKEIENGIIELRLLSSNTANILDIATLKSLNKALQIIKTKQNVRGLMITSDKPHFFLGVDLNEVHSMFQLTKSELKEWLRYTNDLLNQYEKLPFPTVSVISGFALGGGFEFVLTSDFRISEPKTVMGLPITKLGMVPAFGGSVRLPRLIGTEKAINIIAKSHLVPAHCALKLGMIDRISDKENLKKNALIILKEAICGKLDWQTTRSKKRSPIEIKKENSFTYNTINSLKKAKVSTYYPAIKTLMESIDKSSDKPLDEALEIERHFFLHLVHTPQTKALVRMYLNDQFVKYRNLSLIENDIKTFETIGIFGTNLIGNDFAISAAINNIQCVITDKSDTALNKGKQYFDAIRKDNIHFYHLDKDEKEKISGNVQYTRYLTDLTSCPILIDTVSESINEKKQTLGNLEKNASDDTILVTDTDLLSINSLASTLTHPERYCGVHILHPAANTQLIEVVKGKSTSLDTIKTVVQLAVKLGKYPILINDQPGFFINRVLLSYLSAFCNLAMEGINIRYIDNLMEHTFGWSKGPGKLIDILGTDVVYRACQQLTKNYPDSIFLNKNNILEYLYNNDMTGIKNQAGFYLYQKDHHDRITITGLSEKLLSLSSEHFVKPSPKEIIYRLMIPMFNEVIRCLEEEVISTPEECDLALIHGVGFPAFRGGAFHLIDQITIPRYLSVLERYKKYGKNYEAPNLLRNMAASDMVFYPTPPKSVTSLKDMLLTMNTI
ncbi:3-hydroxyacyl-CoA dehydrogenase NAD-binding domain-containing protein [Vibrio salinus]|uniref:3-hydroxyacyl-CoA dehydrogenase NAD-binding domain-containing protein n=1 Tax=Vibrio salinus TaxID=2899784 RepID=UPI001E41CC4C|nr:3-hydroxyacyl-CoA dehydrogenase NAD-binding domain-containing protein [Vibrio salinus]MCE0493607.1 3-hydroxyacyl-CoA dehydrogenase NAD-binding domain-containing protein [Vibrio salinus]